ncbi:hypothetical protein ACFE04_018817 [Oxalis oulophora]
MKTITTTTASDILHHTTTFITDILSQHDLRHRLYTTLRCSDNSTLNLAVESLENTITSTEPNPTSLRVAQKLLHSLPDTSLSSFLLSLVYTLSHQPINAAVSILNLFLQQPSLTRTEIAPVLFQELFLIHLIPVLRSFNERRTAILNDHDHDEDDVECNGDVSVVLPNDKVLSRMNGNQARELKGFEVEYERVVDENCRVFGDYFKQVLSFNSNNSEMVISPPLVVFKSNSIINDDCKMESALEDDVIMGTAEDIRFANVNGRYNNPIWTEFGDKSTEVSISSTTTTTTSSPGGTTTNSKSSPSLPLPPPPNYTLRAPLKILQKRQSRRSTPFLNNRNPNFDSELESSSVESSSSSESEPDIEEKNKEMALFEGSKSQFLKQKPPIRQEPSSFSSDYTMADFDNLTDTPPKTPPKDFVCPITTHLLDDPVTLETGQTYERKAIQEWFDIGNSTCPITRQNLQSTQLPKTNYVLKRLIAGWQDQNPGVVSIQSQVNTPQSETETMFRETIPASSPSSVIHQDTMDGTTLITELRRAISNLCMSEILKESETAILHIKRFWQEMNLDFDIQNMLTKPPVINGFVEVLFNSVDPQVLNAAIFLLCELGSRDKSVIQTLTRVESDVDCIVALFKKGFLEAVVLIYLLKPSKFSLIEMELLESLLPLLKMKDEDFVNMCVNPKSACVFLLGQMLDQSEGIIVSSAVQEIISSNVIDSIVARLGVDSSPEERIAAVGILLSCIREDGNCRKAIVDKAELALILDGFTKANDGERFAIVQFLSELTAPQDQCPVVAGLLLQLDLLAEPKKMSIYREEAIDTLVLCLRNSESPAAQIAAAETIVSLQGRFTAFGKSLTRAILLKRAGLEKRFNSLVRKEQLKNVSGEYGDSVEEEKAANDWERKMAFVLVSHEFGLVFEALAEGLKSRYAELCSACFVAATWLIHTLGWLPDTGIHGAARVCLFKRFMSIFMSAKEVEDKTLSLLVINSFINDPDALHDLSFSIKDIMKGLKGLRKSSPLAFEMLTVLSEGSESSADFWNHKELVQVDSSENGEVLSIVFFKDKFVSGHSDGTIKVWTGKGSVLHCLEEAREHTKAVTSLAILQSGEKLYSGSIDKTILVWSIGDEGLVCTQIHDMKDHIHNLVVSNSIACYVPQGSGVKVHSWSGASKQMNQNKHIKSTALLQGKLYCGCHDNSIQEIDLATGTVSTIQGSYRKLIAKSHPIHALQIVDGLLYSVSDAVDGSVVKIWSGPKFSIVGTLQTNIEVRAMVISSELIYLGSKTGIVEVWDRKKQNKIETLQTGSSSRILSMAIDNNEDFLVIGTADGKIQAWGVS